MQNEIRKTRYVIRDTQNERRRKLKRFTVHVSRITSPKGFTLIELLVVISIIGILIALSLVSYGGAQKQTRDTERRSDLNQYRNTLENFAAANDGLYPSRPSRQNVASAPCSNELADFLSACPDDPGSFIYYYETETGTGCSGGNPCATRYVLAVEIETGDYWEVCSTGEVGKTVCNASTSTNGVCTVGTTVVGSCPTE